MPVKNTSIRRLILKNRKKNESRAAQARRLGIPETTLRYCETNDRPLQGLAGQAFARALGLPDPSAK